MIIRQSRRAEGQPSARSVFPGLCHPTFPTRRAGQLSHPKAPLSVLRCSWHASGRSLGRRASIGRNGAADRTTPAPSVAHKRSPAAQNDRAPLDSLHAPGNRTDGRSFAPAKQARTRGALHSVSSDSRTRPPSVFPLINVAKRSAISTGQLNTSPCVHLPPIDQLVLLGPSVALKRPRNLISRGASHLDAFSGYPFRA